MNNLYVIDANAILRYLLKDNLAQSVEVEGVLKKAKSLGSDVYVTREVVMECVYTLTKFYKVSRSDVYMSLKSFLNTRIIVLEERVFVMKALDCFLSTNISYVDCLVLIKSEDLGGKLVTFDKKLLAKSK